MNFDTAEIKVICPFCKTKGTIKVPVEVYTNKKWGTVKIQIPAGAICKDHHFIVLVDSQGIVRGHEKIEYLTTPQIKTKEKVVLDVSLDDFISTFGKKVMINLLHAITFKYKTYIVKDNYNETLIRNINVLFTIVFHENDHHANLLHFINKNELKRILQDEPGALIIGIKKEILQCPWKGRLDYQKTVLNTVLEIINPSEQIILLQQEMSKFIGLAEAARAILEHGRLMSKSEFLAELKRETKLLNIHKDTLALIKIYIDRHYSPSYWELIS